MSTFEQFAMIEKFAGDYQGPGIVVTSWGRAENECVVVAHSIAHGTGPFFHIFRPKQLRVIDFNTEAYGDEARKHLLKLRYSIQQLVAVQVSAESIDHQKVEGKMPDYLTKLIFDPRCLEINSKSFHSGGLVKSTLVPQIAGAESVTTRKSLASQVLKIEDENNRLKGQLADAEKSSTHWRNVAVGNFDKHMKMLDDFILVFQDWHSDMEEKKLPKKAMRELIKEFRGVICDAVSANTTSKEFDTLLEAVERWRIQIKTI